MRTICTRLLPIAFLVPFTGCLGDDSMGDDHAAFADGFTSARAENDLHHGSISSATSADQMRMEMGRHRDAMGSAMADMTSGMGAMMGGGMMGGGMMGGATMACGTQSGGMTEMMGMMDAMATMEADHDDAMAAADGPDAMRATCDGHHAAMSELMDDLQAAAEGMGCM